MARGGKRPGAGRPHGSGKLDSDQRLWVGARCEELWQEACKEKIEAVRASRRHHYDAAIGVLYEEEQRQERKIGRLLTIRERAEVRRINSDDLLSDEELEFHQADIQKALKQDQGLLPRDIDHIRDEDKYLQMMEAADAVEAASLHRIIAPKPQGEQPRIKEQVRDEVLERYGVPISIGTVEVCWKEFRRLEKQLLDDQDRG